MKTAMQELLDELKEYQLEFNIPIEVIDMCESQLNVEKKQMLDFGLYVKKNGWVGCKIEDLYEDYNNQNK
jgi:hypothetical protein